MVVIYQDLVVEIGALDFSLALRNNHLLQHYDKMWIRNYYLKSFVLNLPHT